jgi:hypothetical protein
MAKKKSLLVIRESGALEFFSPFETIQDVGGLDILKQFNRSLKGR